jgi:NAD(P)-dependent dehydrogenase (short-subunit alcohol dehydrogenase family)
MSDAPAQREPELLGQTVVLIGGSAGIGLETARRARSEGAKVVLTGHNPDRLEHAADEVEAESTAAFDAGDADALKSFFEDLSTPIDHGDGYRRRSPLRTPARDDAGRGARCSHRGYGARPRGGQERHREGQTGGVLLLMGGTGGRTIGVGHEIVNSVTAAMPALTASLALELAPIRVNLIAPGFVDTPLSASILGDDLDKRREELRKTLPIGRVVGPEDIAALAVHLMINTAVTGATYDIDGGQQFVS